MEADTPMWDVIEIDTRDVGRQEARNSQHPYDAAELLRALANKLDSACEAQRQADGRTPFLVHHVACDLREGYLTAYVKRNV